MKVLLSIASLRSERVGAVSAAVASMRRSVGDGIELDVMIDAAQPAEVDGARVRTFDWVRDPRLVAFAHRTFFAEMVDRYDVFSYCEDVSLMSAEGLAAFVEASASLPVDHVAGFVSVAERGDGSLALLDAADHWLPSSARTFGGEVYAGSSNPDSRCYALTRDQLSTCLRSGNFLTAPAPGAHNTTSRAATDPFVRCGLTRVVRVSDPAPFLVRRHGARDPRGAAIDEIAIASRQLDGVVNGSVSSSELLPCGTATNTVPPKDYHDRVDDHVLAAVRSDARRVLSVGCGSGQIEAELVRRGQVVTAIPLDAVIGAVAATRGVEVLSPSLERAWGELDGRRFDALLINDGIHRFVDPIDLLRRLRELAEPGAVLTATIGANRLDARPSALPWWPSVLRGRPASVGGLDVERWLVAGGFTETSTSIRRDFVVVTGSASAPASPREVAVGESSLVSVGVPVYNGMPYLEQSLDALLRQTYASIEIVISDNGSTDGTEAYCRSVAERDPRVRYFRHETNRGAAFNYNFVFAKSRGEFFTWNAHDDIRHPRNVERCVAEIQRLPSSVVTVASSAVFVDDAGALLSFDFDDNTAVDPTPPARMRHVLNHVSRVNSIWGITRASALERTNLIGSFIGSDYVLLAELALLGEVHVLEEQLFSRRLHDAASRQANVSKAEVARWFDVNARVPVLSVRQRLAIEYWHAVGRVGLTSVDQIVARPAIPVLMIARRLRMRGGLVKRRLKRGLRRRT